jgi:hypothetical protein
MSATSAPLALVAELTQRSPLRYVASVQYYGWGLANRRALLPTREQLDHRAATFKLAEERLKKLDLFSSYRTITPTVPSPVSAVGTVSSC